MTINKLFSALAITSVIAFTFMALGLHNLSIQVEQLTSLLVNSKDSSDEASNVNPATLDANTYQKNNFAISNKNLDVLADQISQRVLARIAEDRPSVSQITTPIITESPEINAAAAKYAANIITPFSGGYTSPQDWNEMGKQLAEITDPSEKFQAIGAILGAINSGDLHPPDADNIDYLHALLNPQ